MRYEFGGQDLKKRAFVEQGEAEDLHNFVQAAGDVQFFFYDRYQHIDADGDPDLGLHGVVARTIESLNPQMLLDPLEEQLDLPARLVQPRRVAQVASATWVYRRRRAYCSRPSNQVQQLLGPGRQFTISDRGDRRRSFTDQCDVHFLTFSVYRRRRLLDMHQPERIVLGVLMHLNPVRAGLVRAAVDWPWSSARWYTRRQSVGVPIEFVEC